MDNPEIAPVPVTILTGFLGAGKTTVLNHLLAHAGGQRIFVIENEFGPVSVDAELLLCEPADVIELTGGCLCCSIRGDLARHLAELHRRRAAGELRFDRVIVECTGLADPTPVAQTFFADPAVAAGYLLDAVIAIVDAVHAGAQLDRQPVAQKQIGFADRLLITKSDLAEARALDALCERLCRINPGAPLLIAPHGRIEPAQLLDVRGFNLHEGLLAGYAPARRAAGVFGRKPTHDDEIAAVLLEHDAPLDLDRVSRFMQELLEAHGDELLRYKGILSVADAARRLVFQGVHRIAGFDHGAAWRADEARASRVVLIGRRLPAERLRESFRQTARA